MMDKDIFKNKKIQEIVSGIAEIAGYLWQRGWAEKNAGNISVNVTNVISVLEHQLFENAGTIPDKLTGQMITGLAGQVFLVTCAGTRMREIAKSPLEYICLIRITGRGKIKFLVNLTKEGHWKEPTSELLTHLAIHRMLLSEKPECKAIVHTHSTEMIALTQIKQYKSEKKLNQLLRSMHPEIISFVPQGIGLTRFALPGTPKIASATVKSFKKHDVVVWEKHGILATGKSLSDAFDLIDAIAKSARIFFMSHQAGFEPEGLTSRQLNEIRKYYKL